MLDKLQSLSTAGLAVLLLAVASYAVLQDRWLDDAVRDRNAAITQLHAAERALIVLADQHADELARKTTATEAREAIRSLDVSNEPPVGESLRRVLQAADQIGGMK
jgi:hypothetical protein